MPDEGEQNWGEYRRLILAQLQDLKESVLAVTEKIERFRAEDLAEIKSDVKLLKFQATMVAAIASAIVSIIVGVIIKYVKV
jgi:GTPase Era involved in 16S rRNA processing